MRSKVAYISIDPDIAGEYYLGLTEVEQQLGKKLEGDLQAGRTDGPRAAKVLVTIGQLMAKLEMNRCTDEDWKMIQNVIHNEEQ